MAPKPTNQFRTSPKFGSHRREGNTRRVQSRRPDRRSGRGVPTVIVWVVVICLAGWLSLDRSGNLDSIVAFARTPATDTLSASFSNCGEGRRANCVVDGDTFWYQGQKIRIADIDTPELSPPRCEAERVKGEAAKARLIALLKAGKFSLVAGIRDEDKYGRKLRTVSRDGRSLGDVLVTEGLARSWDGARRSWCDRSDSSDSDSASARERR